MKSSKSTAKTAPSGYITNKLKLHDKDSNDKIPIGNYNEFLTEYDINPSDLALLFFERNKIFKVRDDIPEIISYITSQYQKSYALNAMTILTNDEKQNIVDT